MKTDDLRLVDWVWCTECEVAHELGIDGSLYLVGQDLNDVACLSEKASTVLKLPEDWEDHSVAYYDTVYEKGKPATVYVLFPKKIMPDPEVHRPMFFLEKD